MKKKYRVATLGCRTNQYESQGYADQFEALGWERAGEGEVADLCVVNTCTVTASAHSDSRQVINRLKRENPGAQVAVTGCAVSSMELEDVTIVPNMDKERLVEYLFPDEKEYPEFSIKRFEAHTRAFVKVQDGCNSYCTYCIIPYVRGRSRSRKTEEILAEVRTLVDNGYKEIVLTGINIGDFEHGLADLVRRVDEIDGVERIRVSSIDPDEVDDDLASAILEGKKTCPSMHIVLQAGSNVVLKRMNRKYTRQMFMDSVDRLRTANSDFTFTTDIIVGFPGESDRDHQETLDVMRQVRFAKVHMFPYSDRKRTRAELYPNKVPPAMIRERKHEVIQLSEQIAFELRDQFVGRKMTVLTERGDGSGHTANFLRVLINQPDLKANELIDVVLKENSPTGLIGHVAKA